MKTGDFPHKPEPLARNLAALRKLTRKSKADVGFAVDPDADRLAIVSEGGMPIGEEYTLALAVAHILSKSKTRNPVVVTNLSTTSAIDEIAAKHNASVVRTKIGEINVVEQMKGKGAIIGGEGNGGVIFPEVCYNRDSLTAIALTLEYMAATKKKISRLFAELPRHHMIKAKSKGLPSREIAKTAMIKTREFYANDEIITLDGVKVLFKDKSWLHVRASNTEPVVRIIAESKKLGGAKRLINGFLKKLASEKIRIRLDAQE
jgi:phosphomannomutase